MESKFKQLDEWITAICRFGSSEEFVHSEGTNDLGQKTQRQIFYTRENRYSIVAIEKEFYGPDYLGCTVTTRKPRAGENWNRGRDLADGPFTEETWERIKNDIIAYELVRIAKQRRETPITAGPEN